MNAALVIVALMFMLALGISTAQERVISTLRARTVQVKRYGGGLLIAVGTWLILLAVFADLFARVFPV